MRKSINTEKKSPIDYKVFKLKQKNKWKKNKKFIIN